MVYNYFSKDLSYTVFFISYYMIACSRAEPQQILKCYTLSIFIVIFLTVFLAFSGVLINDNSWYGRYDLGFTYCTFGPNLFLSACLALVAWKKEKMNWKWWGFILLLNQFLFWKTSTDAVYICVLLLFSAWLVLGYSKITAFLERSRVAGFVFSHSAIIFALATIALQMYYNAHSTNASMVWLNARLSTRLHMGQNVFGGYSVGADLAKELLLGLDAEIATYLDSSYLSILTQFGVPLLLTICYLMDSLGKQAYGAMDYYLAVCIVIFMIHCVTDPQLLSFRCNPLIIITMSYYRQTRKHALELRMIV